MKAIELHTRPTFDGLPARKLKQLLADGWQINGYCIQKPNADGWKYGAVTAQGKVLWWHDDAGVTAQREPDAYCVTRDGEYTGWLHCTKPEAEAAVARLSKSYPDELYAFEPVYLGGPDQPDAVGWMVPGFAFAFNEWEEAAMYCDDGERPRALYPARSVAAAHEITGSNP